MWSNKDAKRKRQSEVEKLQFLSDRSGDIEVRDWDVGGGGPENVRWLRSLRRMFDFPDGMHAKECYECATPFFPNIDGDYTNCNRCLEAMSMHINRILCRCSNIRHYEDDHFDGYYGPDDIKRHNEEKQNKSNNNIASDDESLIIRNVKDKTKKLEDAIESIDNNNNNNNNSDDECACGMWSINDNHCCSCGAYSASTTNVLRQCTCDAIGSDDDISISSSNSDIDTQMCANCHKYANVKGKITCSQCRKNVMGNSNAVDNNQNPWFNTCGYQDDLCVDDDCDHEAEVSDSDIKAKQNNTPICNEEDECSLGGCDADHQPSNNNNSNPDLDDSDFIVSDDHEESESPDTVAKNWEEWRKTHKLAPLNNPNKPGSSGNLLFRIIKIDD